VVAFVLATGLLAAAGLPAGASQRSQQPNASTHDGYLLVQYAAAGAGTAPWNAHLLSNAPSLTAASGPRASTSIDGGVQVTFRNPLGHAIWLERTPAGHFHDVDLTSLTGVGPVSGIPEPTVGATGLDTVFCVTTSGDLYQLTWESNLRIINRFFPPVDPYDLWSVRNLTGYGGPKVMGTPSVVVEGTTTYVFARTPSDHLVEYVSQPLKAEPWTAYDLSVESGGPSIESDPAGFFDEAAGQVRVAGTELAPHPGDLVVFSPTDVGGRIWAYQDVSAATGTPPGEGGVSAAETAGEVLLFTPGATGDLMEYAGIDAGTTTSWTPTNLTSTVHGSPEVAGTPAVAIDGTRIAVAAVAEGWGDLFEWDAMSPNGPFSATDVSLEGEGPTRTVAGTPAAAFLGSQLSLYGAGADVPAPEGTGVYAIPDDDLALAIKDGWPILGVTGGLGTHCSPWVGYADPASDIQPDEQVGATIQSGHVRETWLSFWTVSGPGTSAGPGCTRQRPPYSKGLFYDHGVAAGRWVATQIDRYRDSGVYLKPDWVILDPEGYPDNDSGLNGPTSPPSAHKRSIADWYAMLKGWSAGIASVDPTLRAALYADQYQYTTYQLAGLPLPVFVAGAFAEQGSKGHVQLIVPARSAFGSNIRGFVMFNENFTPSCAQLDNEQQLLTEAPWDGDYNTVQTTAGHYCGPANVDDVVRTAETAASQHR
jgi:hypothetical protein